MGERVHFTHEHLLLISPVSQVSSVVLTVVTARYSREGTRYSRSIHQSVELKLILPP